jgi:hypothetical protein
VQCFGKEVPKCGYCWARINNSVRWAFIENCHRRNCGAYRKQWIRKKHSAQYIKWNSATNHGSVQIAGKITSILDIGSNFLPDLTGAQNARMFLTINGVTSDKEAQLIDSIRTFSELGEHFDYPLKTYSNGMYLRLAFATSFF